MKAVWCCGIFLAVFHVTLQENVQSDWWKHAVFYQIYPRSFKDSNNDGIGDIRGIIQKLDHFTESGVNAIWLSPIFKSPQVDMGYDISDYRAIEPDYGTLQDVQELIQKAHQKNIKVILDFVPNHTSDRHQWFIDSVNGVEEFKDYYVWADAKVDEHGNRSAPNNWISAFKNSAWTWNDRRKQYYLHQFSEAQPDLNYRNAKVQQAMKDVLTFWLDLGVDVFRIDAIPHLVEAKNLTNEPKSNNPGATENDYDYLDHIYTKDQPETYSIVYDWRTLVDEYTKKTNSSQRILMTEAYSDVNKVMLYFGTADGSKLGAHFTFNFNLIFLNINSTALEITNSIKAWLDNLPKIYNSNWVLGNHDQHRVATRFGPENVDGFNMLNMVLPGVAVTYNGEEIGQEDGEVAFSEGKDPQARDPAYFQRDSRDFERTPFQWDSSINAGFNKGAKTWLPVSKKYVLTNLESEKAAKENSHYKVYQSLTKLRANEILRSGSVDVKAIEDHVLLVKRSLEGKSLALIFNNGNSNVVVNVEKEIGAKAVVQAHSTHSFKMNGSSLNGPNLILTPHEAIVVSF